MYTASILNEGRWEVVGTFDEPFEAINTLLTIFEYDLGRVTNQDCSVIWCDPDARNFL